LAVPVGESPQNPPPPPTHLTPRGNRGHPAQATPSVDPGDAAHAAAIRRYRNQYLSMREGSTTRLDVSYDYVPYGVYGGWRRRFGFGMVAVPHTYVSQGTQLAVFEGPHRLDVPATYEALGDQDGLDRLNQRIRTNKSWANVGYTVALAGVATSIVGLVEMDNTRSWREAQQWGTVTGAGVGLMLGGVIGGAIPSARAQRLQYDHSLSFDLDDLKSDFAAHNVQLASQLGLSQTEAANIERR